MTKIKLYLVRHGLTVGNIANMHQTAETPLAESGVEQAKSVAKRLKDKKIDLIYSSPHLRTQQTSEIISKEIGSPIELWKNLTEVKRPSEVEGKSVDDPEIAKIDDLVRENFTNRDWKYSNEENFEDIAKRGQAVLNHLIDKHQDQTVLCVSHGTFIKVLLASMIFRENLTPEIFSDFRYNVWAQNTGVSVAEYTEEHGWRILTINDISHL